MKFKPFFLLILFPVLASCVKDKPTQQVSHAPALSTAQKVFVVNEGGFGYGNASVSLYDPGSGHCIEDIYKDRNHSDVGDVAQSLCKSGNRYYLVVNNSGKIAVCDPQFRLVGQVTDLQSPRYLLPITNQKAYVTDYAAGAISIVDLSTHLKTGAIACPGWTERLLQIYNKAFVTNLRRPYVYVVNTLNDAIADSVFVGINASSLVLDKNDRVWVLSGGDKSQGVAARLCRIHPVNLAVEAVFTFPAGASPSSLCLNGGKDSLYFLNGGIWCLPAASSALPTSPLVPASGRNFYGLGVDPVNHRIYAADALDYAQRANVYIFSASGAELSFFKAGINANGFYFE